MYLRLIYIITAIFNIDLHSVTVTCYAFRRYDFRVECSEPAVGAGKIFVENISRALYRILCLRYIKSLYIMRKRWVLNIYRQTEGYNNFWWFYFNGILIHFASFVCVCLQNVRQPRAWITPTVRLSRQGTSGVIVERDSGESSVNTVSCS